jgi:pyrroline-5-carboxylate reductase
MLKTKKIGFIGGGAMGEALLRGIVNAKLVSAAQITVSDIAEDRLKYIAATYGVATTTDGLAVAGQSDVLLLAVKPQIIFKVLDSIAAAVGKTTTVISIAGGVAIADLEEKLPGVPVIRVMPNTPAAVGAGMSAVALGKLASATDGELAASLFASVGKVVTVGEEYIDAITGISGCGPAFVYVLIDALSDAGVLAGLTRQMSVTLAAQTMYGAAKMVLESGEHPAKLRDMVTSPGGSTIVGVHTMEQKGVRAAMIDAVLAAVKRSREMGKK